MNEDNVVSLNNPASLTYDPLTEIIRQGARQLLMEALELEVNQFIDQFRELRTQEGSQRVIRNGYLPEREIQTGIGAVSVKVPRVRDKGGRTQEKIRFNSSILPPYLRKSRSMEELIPCLYLKGISTGDFSEALAALVGKEAQGFSPSTISRLKEGWQAEKKVWDKRDLSDQDYVYLWADGIHCQVRMDSNQCLLVIMGATADGAKKLIALEEGYRESEQSWLEVLLDLKNRGLHQAPQLAIGDGALGFWKAIGQVYPQTQWQRCWVHKTANVLNKLPKKTQPKAKQKLHDIWMAETKKEAKKAFELFIKTYQAKYPKAAECLRKDRDKLLSFYDFPAEHWAHLRTTNPIESTFATVRLRTDKVRGCFSAITVVTMAFQLCLSAEKRWRRLNAPKKIMDVMKGKKFIDGIRFDQIAA